MFVIASHAPRAQAGATISDLSDTSPGNSSIESGAHPFQAQEFNQLSGTIDSLKVQFTVTAAAKEYKAILVFMYTANSSGIPNETLSKSWLLGTMTTGKTVANQQYTFTPVANSIAADYGGVDVDVPLSRVGFGYTTTATTGLLGGRLSATGSTWTS